MSEKTSARAAALLVGIAPFIYFFPAVRGQLVLCPDDGWLSNLPLRITVAREVLDAHLPLWNPYIFGGYPLFGASQAGILLPLNWYFLFLSAPVAMNLAVLSTYALSGVGAYLFARRSGTDVFGSMITGLVWQLSGFFIAHIGHTVFIQTAGLLPWILWAVDGHAGTGRRLWALMIATLVALQTFAGHPQALVYSLLLAAAYGGCMALSNRILRLRYLGAVAMLAGGLALAAVQILPTLELARNSFRAQITYEFFTSLSLPPKFLFTFFAPYLFGGGDGRFFTAPYIGPAFYGEYAGYVGVTTLTLAIAAPLIKRDARTKFWSVAAVVGLGLALGQFWPFNLYHAIFHVPPLNLFRVPARHLLEVDFALAVLAGRAVSAVSITQNRKRIAAVILVVSVGVLVCTCLSVTVLRPSTFRLERTFVSALRAPELFLPLIFALAAVATLWMFARGWQAGRVLLFVVIALDLSLWGQSSGWRLSPSRDSALWQEPPAVAFLRQHERDEKQFRVLSLLPPPDPSVSYAASRLGITESVLTLEPNTYMMHGIQNAAGYDTFGLERYSRLADDMKLWGELREPERSLSEGREFDVLNVRYLLAKHFAADASRWQPVAQLGDISIYKNLRALPRAWLAISVTELPEDALLKVIRTGKFADGQTWEPLRTALMDAPLQMNFGGEDVERKAEVVRYEPNRIELQTNCGVSSVLVLSENHYSGWRAYVDGKLVPTLRINYNLRGVALSPGEHSISFVYRPKSVLLGLLISLFTGVFLLAWCLQRRRQNDQDSGE